MEAPNFPNEGGPLHFHHNKVFQAHQEDIALAVILKEHETRLADNVYRSELNRYEAEYIESKKIAKAKILSDLMEQGKKRIEGLASIYPEEGNQARKSRKRTGHRTLDHPRNLHKTKRSLGPAIQCVLGESDMEDDIGLMMQTDQKCG